MLDAFTGRTCECMGMRVESTGVELTDNRMLALGIVRGDFSHDCIVGSGRRLVFKGQKSTKAYMQILSDPHALTAPESGFLSSIEGRRLDMQRAVRRLVIIVFLSQKNFIFECEVFLFPVA